VIDLDDVRAAAARLEGVVHRTPVLTSAGLDARTGARVHLKAECFQRIGAFKARGAGNKVAALSDEERARGLAAVSSGNHAQAVALAAGRFSARATIVMPSDAPAEKVAATRALGADIVEYERYEVDREELFAQVVAERGLTPVHPYDDPLVMAGQGTVALELLEQAGELDVLLVCVGGGGLIAGCATAAKALVPGIRVVGVEPEAGDDTRRSLAAGKRVRIPVPRTIADGTQASIPGELTFEVNRRLVDEIVTVSDEEIVAAMAFLFERLKVVAEPSGALALAALLSGRVDARGLRVGVTITGGNVSPERFAALLASTPRPT
jgi:threo-3-hydroxy-L-aspartate ammonia-lyase